MKLSRYCIFSVMLFASCVRSMSGEGGAAEAQQEEVKPRFARWLRVFSRGPHPDDEVYKGKEIFNHVDNVLKGGTLGLEVNLKKQVGKLSKWWQKVKHFLPAMRRYTRREGEREVEERTLDIDPRKRPLSPASDKIREWEHVGKAPNNHY